MFRAFLLILVIWSCSAFARWQKPDEADFVIEKDLSEIEVFKDGTVNMTTETIVRIQGEGGKGSRPARGIGYDSSVSKVEIIEAYTLNEKEKVRVEPSDIEDLDTDIVNGYDSTKRKSITFPKVSIGSKLYLKYRTIHFANPLKGSWSKTVVMAPGDHVEKTSLVVKSQLPLYVKVNDPNNWASVQVKGKFNVEVRNRRPIPGSTEFERDSVFLDYRSTKVWISTHEDWSDFYRELASEVEGIVSQPIPSGILSWVNQAKALSNDEERIVFLSKKIGEEFRYFGDWRGGGYRPRQLAEIEKSRYGDCKDLSVLLVSLLRALKYDAHAAVVERSQSPSGYQSDYPLPSAHVFNHQIVHLKVGNKTYWLDPTNWITSLTPLGDIRGRPALILDKKRSHFERIPEVTSKDFTEIIEEVVEFKGADQVLRHLKHKYVNLYPSLIAQDYFGQSGASVLSRMAVALAGDAQIISAAFIKPPIFERELKDIDQQLELTTNDPSLNTGKFRFLPIEIPVLTSAFFETEKRVSDLRIFEHPFLLKATARLKGAKLVKGTDISCKSKNDWISFDISVIQDKEDIVTKQTLELHRPFVRQSEFSLPSFKVAQRELRACAYKVGVLYERQRH